MSYYEDLTVYAYKKKYINENTYNIGWLDINEQYTKGKVPKIFIDKLWRYCLIKLVEMRGFHTCNLCQNIYKVPLTIKIENISLKLGTSEIRVFGKNKIYAAPNLIYHYITEHSYQPPEEFISAVINGPSPESDIYKELIKPILLID